MDATPIADAVPAKTLIVQDVAVDNPITAAAVNQIPVEIIQDVAVVHAHLDHVHQNHVHQDHAHHVHPARIVVVHSIVSV